MGGFPEYVLEGDPQIIKNYFYDIIYKDIVSRYDVRDVKTLENLLLYLISNCGSITSLYSLRKIYEKSFDTIKEYINYFEQAFLIFELKKYSHSLKKQDFSGKKYYIIDNSFISLLSFEPLDNLSKLFENLVFLELKKQNKELFYYKTKNDYEIDFLVKNNKSFDAYQVCLDMKNEKTEKREIKSFLDAKKELQIDNFYLITKDAKKTIKIDGIEIKVTPFYEWCLI